MYRPIFLKHEREKTKNKHNTPWGFKAVAVGESFVLDLLYLEVDLLPFWKKWAEESVSTFPSSVMTRIACSRFTSEGQKHTARLDSLL